MATDILERSMYKCARMLLVLPAVLFLHATAAAATKDTEYQHSHNNIRGGGRQGSTSATKSTANELTYNNQEDKEQRRLGKINGSYQRANRTSIEAAWVSNVLNKTLPPELNIINADDDDNANEESDTGYLLVVGEPLQEDDGDDFYFVDFNATVVTTTWGGGAANTTVAQTATPAVPTLTPSPTRNPAAVTFIGDGGGLNFPLQQCQGDCDRDSDCAGPNLICFQRTFLRDEVPGCLLLDTVLLDAMDICIDPFNLPSAAPTMSLPPTIAPTVSPSWAPIISPSETPSVSPTVSPTRAPNTIPSVAPSVSPTVSPSRKPSAAPSISPSWPYGTAVRVGNGGENPEVFPLQACQGDCDSDSDCDGELVCWQRSRATDPLPGCTGSLEDGTDICVEQNFLPTSSPTMRPTPRPTFGPGESFKIRMYWNNYLWQEENFERRWCVSYDYPRSYCWYESTEKRSCRSDEMYVDRCGESRYRQDFELIEFGNGEALIKVAGQNRCWTRRSGSIKLEACDYLGGNDRQHFDARDGDFNSERFEIRNSGSCVTTHHHPKEREVVQLDGCGAARSATTNYWRLDK